MNEKGLWNVTLYWCIYVSIWDESIIFLNQFMKKKVFKKWTNILFETMNFIGSWMKTSIKCNSTLMYPRQHLRRKHHILDWIHIISVHEGKRSIKSNSTLMYPRQHLRRQHHILDWIHIISVHEGKKSIKFNSTLMYPHQHLRRKHHILDWLETFVHPFWHWSQSQISRTIPYDPQHFWFHT